MAYHIPKTKVPPWFAVHVGSVVKTDGAKIQPFFLSIAFFLKYFLHYIYYHSFMSLPFFQINSAESPLFFQVQSLFNPNRSLGNRKLRSNCRIVQRTGISPAPYPCSAYPPCAVERQRSPLATERGRSILHCYSIVIASLLDMIMGNKPRSRQHRAEIERPKWVVQAVS